MGMSSSDDEAQIRRDHDKMEHIRRHRRDYHEKTERMNEDEKAIYDDSLKRKYDEVFPDTSDWDGR